MKKFMSVLLVCVLLFSVSMTGAQAEGIYYGIVNGGNANRVNLRASTSVSSQSLGVYYTGTPVVCMGDAGHGWTQVYVGTQLGYMMTRYITKTNSALPTGMVLGQTALYAEAQSGTVLAYCYQGQSVTILGETNSQWYYVLTDGRVGYIPANLIQVGGGSTPGASYGTALINGGSADRVNLRAGQSTSSKSLGVYFQGTTVELRSSARTGWIPVTIGTVNGYINAQYLSWGTNVTNRQPTMKIRNINSSWVNLRAEPTTASQSQGRLYNGTQVTVIGETYDFWYYVYTGSQFGYVYADFLQ